MFLGIFRERYGKFFEALREISWSVTGNFLARFGGVFSRCLNGLRSCFNLIISGKDTIVLLYFFFLLLLYLTLIFCGNPST